MNNEKYNIAVGKPIARICQHNISQKLWTPIRTLKINRDGFGGASKIILETCKRCGENRERKMSFTDLRINYK